MLVLFAPCNTLGAKLLSREIARGDVGRGLLGWRGSGLRLDDTVKSPAVTSGGGGGGPPGFGRPFDNASASLSSPRCAI